MHADPRLGEKAEENAKNGNEVASSELADEFERVSVLAKETRLGEATALLESLVARIRSQAEEAATAFEGKWLDVLMVLSDLYVRQDRFEEARITLAETVAESNRVHGPNSWRTSDARRRETDVKFRSSLPDASRRELEVATRMGVRVVSCLERGELSEAIAVQRSVLDVRQRVLGELHPESLVSLNDLAELHRLRGDVESAAQLHQRALNLRERVLGITHPDYARSLHNLAIVHVGGRQFWRGEPMLRRATRFFESSLGAAHPDYATSVHNLAYALAMTYHYAEAEREYRNAIELRTTVLGESHPDCVASLCNLAGLYRATGDYAAAASVYKQVSEMKRRLLGSSHPDSLTAANSLALMYRMNGDFARAEPLYRQVLEIRKSVLGEVHADYAVSLNNLADLYRATGEFDRAEALYRQALEIRGKVFGEQHVDYAVSLGNLAGLYLSREEPTRAVPLLEKATEIMRRAGEWGRDYGVSLNNLAAAYEAAGDGARAVRYCRQSLEVLGGGVSLVGHLTADAGGIEAPSYPPATLEGLLVSSWRAFGGGSPFWKRGSRRGSTSVDRAAALGNLGELYRRRGHFALAMQFSAQALEITKQSVGENHLAYATSLAGLAAANFSRRKYARAESQFRQAAEVVSAIMEATADSQGERRQLTMTASYRGVIDQYLSAARHSGSDPARMYSLISRWKGAVLGRQLDVPGSALDVEGQTLWEERQRITRELATLASAAPETREPMMIRRLEELSQRKERVESELAARSVSFSQGCREAASTPKDIQRLLPDGTAVVDFVAYLHSGPSATAGGSWATESHLLSFVLRRDRAMAIVDLGRIEPVAQAISIWRAGVLAEGDVADAGQRLRSLVWQPIRPHLEGATTVLVSPDSVLGALPFGALPGDGPGRFLIEERRFVTVPSLRSVVRWQGKGKLDAGPTGGLLAVGDVDYAGDPGAAGDFAMSRSAGTRADDRPQWDSLRNTGPEIESIRAAFTRAFEGKPAAVVRGAEATEAIVRERAPKVSYLHAATHGFFLPEEKQPSAPAGGRPLGLFENVPVTGFHPDLRSGIVLAGANQRPDPDKDDGILTAMEVASLDLRGTDLVVLSACDTGLGKEVAGEGFLGLQRAFHAAGARSVIASLWQVNDAAARTFMERFYANLWVEQMAKGDALREAQLWMIAQGREAVREAQAAAQAADPPDEGSDRGVAPTNPRGADFRRILGSPAAWAAWVLSGDWN